MNNATLTACDGGSVTVDSILSMPIDGGAPTTVVTGLAQLAFLAFDTNYVYWSALDGTIARAPR